MLAVQVACYSVLSRRTKRLAAHVDMIEKRLKVMRVLVDNNRDIAKDKLIALEKSVRALEDHTDISGLRKLLAEQHLLAIQKGGPEQP